MTQLAHVSDELHGEIVLAAITGEIDASNADRVGRDVRELVTNRRQGLILDLSQITYLDSAGIALLFELAGQLAEHRQTFAIVVAPEATIARVLMVSGVDRTLPLHATREQALAG